MLPLLLAVPALVQTVPTDPSELPGPWERMLENHRTEQFPWPKWRLLARVPIDPAVLRTIPILRLLSSGELALNSYSEKEIAAFWAQKEWTQGPDWALISPDGDLAATGSGTPTGAALEAPISKSGWKSRGERFAEFAKSKDGSGEAWGDALLDAGRLMAFVDAQLKADAEKPLPWWVWETPPPDASLLALQELCEKEWVQALHGLRRHKGYVRWPGLPGALSMAPESPAQSMRDALRPMLGDLIQELHRTPQSEGVWAVWSQVARRLPAAASEFTPSLFAVPEGDPWPPPAGLRAVLPLLRARGDLRILLAYCRNQLQAPIPETIGSEAAWRGERMQRIQDWGLPGLEALVRLKAESDGLVWIDELHRLWGKDWEKSNLHAFLRRIDQEWLPESWDKALRAEPLEDPPLPQTRAPLPVPAIALDSQADRALERAWKTLRDSPALDAWGPGDLRWTSLSKEQLKVVRKDFGLDAKPRWFLFQGRNLIASGTSAPDPAYLQGRLRSLGVPRLEVLNLFLSQHPEHKEAHIERFHLLRNRLPQQRLEAEFRQDAESALLPITPAGTWSPSGEAWISTARRVLPELEEYLRHWPSDLGAWKAWIAWSELSPQKPKALTLAETLEPWPKQRIEAAQLIAGQLRNRGDWKNLQRFAQERWDALVEQARPIHPAIPELDARMINELDIWLSFLEEALTAQGQSASIQPLRARYKELSLRKPPGR